jgi:hypothetical protein
MGLISSLALTLDVNGPGAHNHILQHSSYIWLYFDTNTRDNGSCGCPKTETPYPQPPGSNQVALPSRRHAPATLVQSEFSSLPPTGPLLFF